MLRPCRLTRSLWSILALAVACVVGCGGHGAGADGGASGGAGSGDGSAAAPDGGGGDAACRPAPAMTATPAVKVCQLTGDTDRQLGAPTLNRTGERAGVWGTDLGSSFEHKGALWLLFGDTIPTASGAPLNTDSIATSSDTDPDDCVAIDVLTDPGGAFHPPTVPGVDLAAFHVPLDGVSAGDSMYVWFSTGGTNVMERSVLARSDDDARSFSPVREFGSEHFINISADVVPAGQTPGLPAVGGGAGGQVMVFGSGAYRASDVYLATTPLGDIEDAGALRYFAGAGKGGCSPRWASDESEARPIFDTTDANPDLEGCVGELSVHYSEVLGLWLALYNCSTPRGIVLRAAHQPWGPWSESLVAFDPADGYCAFMHASWASEMCDSVQDPGRDNEWGGEYGPYILERFTRGDASSATLYFVMSTWNPYNTVVMKTDVSQSI